MVANSSSCRTEHEMGWWLIPPGRSEHEMLANTSSGRTEHGMVANSSSDRLEH
jgi:hypothetical protein